MLFIKKHKKGGNNLAMTGLEMHENIINVGFFSHLFLVLFRKLHLRVFCNGNQRSK